MNVLVTGGAGYLGSTLVRMLLDDPDLDRITVVDNFAHGQNSLSDCCMKSDFVVVDGDARDMDLMRRLVREADVVIPLAAIVGAPACKRDWNGALSLNYIAIANLMGILSDAQWVLFPNTNSGYGVGGETECDEDSPMNPLTHYAKTKADAERCVMERENSIAFRLATLFGPSARMRLDLMVNDFTWRALQDKALVVFEGHFRRNFVHVDDAAWAFVHAIDNFSQMRSNVYNVGLSSANMTKLDLCAKIKEHLSEFTFVEAQVGSDPDKRDYVVSNAKIEASGWEPRWSLDQGIAQLLKLYPTLKNAIHVNA